MEATELRQQVESFKRWHYTMELGQGVVTPGPDPNRTEQRRRYAFDRLLTLMGGTLKGMRVLDLGCNAGYWSLCAIEADADYVFGIDGRQMHVDQSNLVFEAKGIDPSRYHFELGNFLTYPFDSFDLVLCFGVLYHVASPVELFNVMAGTKADVLVIDSAVSNLPGNAFSIQTENLKHNRNAVDEEVVTYPTRGAVSMLAGVHGYECVTLDPSCITDFTGMSDYQNHWRVAFIASKSRSLAALPQETVPRLGLLARLRQAVS
jgi:tRNA (mo5U34)-methyltransferase